MPPPFSILLAQHSAGSSRFALDLLAILSASSLVTLLLRRFPQAMIPCYLIAGALIGPSALGLAGGTGETQSVSSIATILLMFTIGLHLDVAGIRGGLAPIALITTLSTIASVALVWPIGIALGLPLPGALAAAMAMSISSTAVVLRTLEQRRELHRVHGRLTFGVLLMQDMAALALMALLPLLATWAKVGAPAAERTPGLSGVRGPLGVIADVSIAIGGISALIVVSRLVLPRILRAAAGTGEALLVISSAIALGDAVATAGLGFSPELGAFLAGFILASTPFRYQLAGQLVPLRDLFLAIFFTAIGLSLPLKPLGHEWLIALLMALGIMAVKTLVIAGTSWAAGAAASVALYAGLAMAQGGEFSLVILAQANRTGVIGDDTYAAMIAAAVLTLVATPGLVELARWVSVRTTWIPPARWVKASALREAPPESPPAEPLAGSAPPEAGLPLSRAAAIVAGFGPVGRAVADNLEKQGVRVNIIELNPRTVERQHGLGRSITYGDASNPEVLERAGLSHASAVILTMPDEEAVLRACRFIRSIRHDIFIAARLNALSKALQAMQLGADHTVVEELATADAMAREVMLKLGQRAAGEDTGPRLYEFER